MPKLLKIGASTPVPEVQDMCRELMRMADTGELRSLAATGICTGRQGYRGWASSDTDDGVVLIGNVAQLQYILTQTLVDIESGEEPPVG